MNKSEPNPAARSARRKKLSVPLGAAFLLLAGIGLIAVAMFTVNVVHGLMDNSDQKARYERFITPVVMMDPVPFSNIQNVEEDFLLQSSLWAALLGENRENYSYDDMGLLLLPSSDVDVAAAKLFGPSVSLIHRTFYDYDASYLFDPEISAYRVPLIAKVAYSPSVQEITKNGDRITLKVGYVAPGNIWSTNIQTETNKPAPDKYMLYDLAKWEEGYYIRAVRDVDENAPPIS